MTAKSETLMNVISTSAIMSTSSAIRVKSFQTEYGLSEESKSYKLREFPGGPVVRTGWGTKILRGKIDG